jgi:hypothetical protein
MLSRQGAEHNLLVSQFHAQKQQLESLQSSVQFANVNHMQSELNRLREDKQGLETRLVRANEEAEVLRQQVSDWTKKTADALQSKKQVEAAKAKLEKDLAVRASRAHKYSLDGRNTQSYFHIPISSFFMNRRLRTRSCRSFKHSALLSSVSWPPLIARSPPKWPWLRCAHVDFAVSVTCGPIHFPPSPSPLPSS